MKGIVTILCGLCLALSAVAQTPNEWFSQKKTQIRYLAEQIAALRAFRTAVKKGYEISKDGLQAIGLTRQNDLQIHQEFYGSLGTVKPAIIDGLGGKKLAEMQKQIVSVYQRCKLLLQNPTIFAGPERLYLQKIIRGVLEEFSGLQSEVSFLISQNGYRLSDDERLRRITTTYTDLQDLYAFLKHFKNRMSMVTVTRLKEERESRKLKSIY